MLLMYVCYYWMEQNLNNEGKKIKIVMKGKNYMYLYIKIKKIYFKKIIFFGYKRIDNNWNNIYEIIVLQEF